MEFIKYSLYKNGEEIYSNECPGFLFLGVFSIYEHTDFYDYIRIEYANNVMIHKNENNVSEWKY